MNRAEIKVRPAVPADLKQCAALDHHLTTDRVWQVDRREDNGAVFVSFHSVRLPRPMRVFYPRDPQYLWNDWRQWNSFLVADEAGYIRGYSGLLVRTAEGQGWLRDLVVGRPHRRSGIGSSLLQETIRWSTEQELRFLTVELQSKNYPAIRFYKKHGFSFCGYNEYYYPSQDIALFFSVRLS